MLHPKLVAYIAANGLTLSKNAGGKRSRALSYDYRSNTVREHTSFYYALCDLFNEGRYSGEQWKKTAHSTGHIAMRGILKKDGFLNYSVSGAQVQFVNVI